MKTTSYLLMTVGILLMLTAPALAILMPAKTAGGSLVLSIVFLTFFYGGAVLFAVGHIIQKSQKAEREKAAA